MFIRYSLIAILLYSNFSYAQCLQGDCVNKTGTYIYKNGAKYQGQFASGLPNGKGTFSSSYGDVYIGEWKAGVREGKGKLKFKNGNIFEGTFIKNMFQFGTMKYINGDKFIGEWVENKQQGAGTYYFSNGDKYEGPFFMGTLNGKGSLTYADGKKFEGNWIRNKKNGEGSLYDIDGKLLQKSMWKDNVQEYASALVNNYQPTTDTLNSTQIYALIIGVSRYNSMPSLKYSDDDAYRLYAFYKSPEGGALPDNQLKVLIDEDATRSNILNTMRELANIADDNDEVIIYFSGHGVNGGFVPFDYDGRTNIVFHQEVNGIIKESKAKYKLCLADACHSGSMLTAKSIESVTANFYKILAESNGGYALVTSSNSAEVSLEAGGLRSGVFSHYLIKGLSGQADSDRNRVVTIKELFIYIQSSVVEYTKGAQNPEISGDFADDMPLSFTRK
jgi:hypothetical protein